MEQSACTKGKRGPPLANAILDVILGCLPNPNSQVFFIAIPRIKQASRLQLGMLLDFNLTRWNNEKRIENILR